MTTEGLCRESLIPMIREDEHGKPEEYMTCTKLKGSVQGMPEQVTLRLHSILEDEDLYAVYTLTELHRINDNLEKINIQKF